MGIVSLEIDITGAADIYTSSKWICCGKQGRLGTWERSDTKDSCIEFCATHGVHSCLSSFGRICRIFGCLFVRCMQWYCSGDPEQLLWQCGFVLAESWKSVCKGKITCTDNCTRWIKELLSDIIKLHDYYQHHHHNHSPPNYYHFTVITINIVLPKTVFLCLLSIYQIINSFIHSLNDLFIHLSF